MKNKIIKVLEKYPGLTGKQIAHKLKNVGKSEVNSYLYNNSDGFVQKDWRWYLLDEDFLEIQLTCESWIDETSFEEDLVRSDFNLVEKPQKLTIKFPKKCKILLVVIARIISVINQAIFKGFEVELDFSECPSTRYYLDRLGFFEHLHVNVKVRPRKSKQSLAARYEGNSPNLVEMAEICLDRFDYSLPETLTKAFVYHAGQSYYHAAFTIFAELIGNIQEHSETPIPGTAALQFYRGKRRHIQTVISDSGLGIATTLKNSLSAHYPEISKDFDHEDIDSEIDLVKIALTKGGLSQFGSDPELAARGLGLKKTQKYAAKYSAIVIVRQPLFEIRLQYKNGSLVNTKIFKNLVPLMGTQICFDFFLD